MGCCKEWDVSHNTEMLLLTLTCFNSGQKPLDLVCIRSKSSMEEKQLNLAWLDRPSWWTEGVLGGEWKREKRNPSREAPEGTRAAGRLMTRCAGGERPGWTGRTRSLCHLWEAPLGSASHRENTRELGMLEFSWQDTKNQKTTRWQSRETRFLCCFHKDDIRRNMLGRNVLEENADCFVNQKENGPWPYQILRVPQRESGNNHDRRDYLSHVSWALCCDG